MRILLSFILVLVIVPHVFACSCGNRGIEHSIGSADAVFYGKVTDVDMSLRGWGGIGRKATISVENVWKGEVPEKATVKTGFGGGDCGIEFSTGDTYVVFGYGEEGTYSTGLCSGTIWYSKEEVQSLKESYAPIPVEEGGIGMPFIIAGLAVFLFFLWKRHP